MKIAILGNGKEGQAVKAYFEAHNDECKVFENFADEDVKDFNLDQYDLVMRSPSVRPQGDWSSSTKYFFEKCPARIIGVTGTKGKGTTCSLIKSVFEAMDRKVWLVGNIGVPAIEVLDKIESGDVVVYEMSSFQLWDLYRSPNVAVVLGIEPDHLNVHKDFAEYVDAKSNIVKWQNEGDVCVYYKNNKDSIRIAEQSPAEEKLAYPVGELIEATANNEEEKTQLLDKLKKALNSLSIVGNHNMENAQAAMLAACGYLGIDIKELLNEHLDEICQGFKEFKGLPHRLQLIRELDSVKYYDDNFATNVASTKVAIEAFNVPLVMIVGGRDKTDYEDLPELNKLLSENNLIKKVVLMGESGVELMKKYENSKYVLVKNLEEAVEKAREFAEPGDVVLMSPAAASFDMFENVYDRGAQFVEIVNNLK